VSIDPHFDVDAVPGASAQKGIRVINIGDEEIRVAVSVEDYLQSAQGQARFLPPGTSPAAAGGWVQLGERELRLRPGEMRFVPVSVKVPESAKTGSYGAMVFFSGTPVKDNLEGTGARLVARAGSLVLVRVRGSEPLVERGRTVGISFPRIAFSYPVPVTVRYRNEGNVHSKVTVLVELDPLGGGEKMEFKAAERRILPGTEAAIEASVSRGPAFGAWRITARAINERSAPLGPAFDGGTLVVVLWEIPMGILLSMLGGVLLALAVRRRPRPPAAEAAQAGSA